MLDLFSKKPAVRPTSKNAKLGFLSLEGRDLMSVSPIATAQMAIARPVSVPPALVSPLPNLAGLTFHLISSNGAPAHDLTIQTETFLPNGTAKFTGTWRGGNTSQVMNGLITRDAKGTIRISFTWNGNHAFNGTITTVAGPYGAAYSTQYHIQGDVTVNGSPGGPGHVSGNGVRPMVYQMVRLN